jgi:beta-galactosidase
VRVVGKGRVIYAGTYMTEALAESFLADELRRAGIEPLLADKLAGIEVSLREGPAGRLLFVLNTTHEPVALSGVPAARAVVGDGAFQRALSSCRAMVARWSSSARADQWSS